MYEYKKKFGTSEIKEWNNTTLWLWEFEYLKDIDAISEKGILCEYPMLSVIDKKTNLERTQEYNGDLSLIKSKIAELINSGYTAYIKYTPKKYVDYLKLQKIKIAQSMNEPLISEEYTS